MPRYKRSPLFEIVFSKFIGVFSQENVASLRRDTSLEVSLFTFVNKLLVNYKIVCIGYIREHVACGRLHITKVRFMKKYINEKWPVKLILLSPFEV